MAGSGNLESYHTIAAKNSNASSAAKEINPVASSQALEPGLLSQFVLPRYSERLKDILQHVLHRIQMVGIGRQKHSSLQSQAPAPLEELEARQLQT